MTLVTESIELGASFSGPVRIVSIARMLAFSGGPFESPGWPARNLHTDAGKASDAGLDAPIASGLQAQGHVTALFEEMFGDDWFRHGRMHIKLPKVVKAGDSVQAMATLTSKETDSNGTRFDFEIWCDNQDGEKVLVGTASCVLPA